jgi:hypothetical protein
MHTSPTFRYDRDIQQMIVQYRAASTGEVSLQIPAPIDVRTLREATVSPVIAAVVEMMDPLADGGPVPTPPAPVTSVRPQPSAARADTPPVPHELVAPAAEAAATPTISIEV